MEKQMSTHMMEKDTIWIDEAPPSTPMRSKKNIKKIEYSKAFRFCYD